MSKKLRKIKETGTEGERKTDREEMERDLVRVEIKERAERVLEVAMPF